MGGSSTRPRSRSAWSPPRQTPSSSVDSSGDSPPRLNSSTTNGDREDDKSSYLDTDLRLGLGRNIHIPLIEFFGERRHDWSPIKPLPRSTIAGSFFVKVYMEGVLIGRKLDVLAQTNYDDLIASLARMFNANIHSPGESATTDGLNKHHMLMYVDKNGNWMMVGDVSWEMFKCTVKRMMITRANKC